MKLTRVIPKEWDKENMKLIKSPEFINCMSGIAIPKISKVITIPKIPSVKPNNLPGSTFKSLCKDCLNIWKRDSPSLKFFRWLMFSSMSRFSEDLFKTSLIALIFLMASLSSEVCSKYLIWLLMLSFSSSNSRYFSSDSEILSPFKKNKEKNFNLKLH